MATFQHNDPNLLDKITNVSNCCATQSKVKPEQCKNKRKDQSIFCGVHSSCNVDRIFSPFFHTLYPKSIETKSFVLNDEKDIRFKEIDIDIEDNNEDNIIEDDNHLRNLILSQRASILNVTTLRNYIKNHPKLKMFIHVKGSKNSMISELHHYYTSMDIYLSSEDKIIMVQSIIRRWSVMRRNICSNKTDILSMDPIYDIPIMYFYIFEDKVNKNKYGFDIRTFTKILYDPTQNPKFVAKCPYTIRPYEVSEIAHIEMYIAKLKKSGIVLDIEKPKLSKEKEIEMKCIDIFLRMDMLDNYTQSRWFMELNIPGLLKFYNNARDIWNYRINMPLQNKLRIVSSGRGFEMPIGFLANLPSKLALQNFVLMEIDRFISEGINREEKKLGAMLMLTALVEVSHDAAEAMPHLVQIF